MRPDFRNRAFGPQRDFGPWEGNRRGGGPGGCGPGGYSHRLHGPRDPFAGREEHPLREFMRGRGHRARPGNLRNAILALLVQGPLNGYGIIQAVSERSGGLWQPSSGAVYPALQLLEDEGLIQPASDGRGRAYTLSEAGQAYVQEHEEELKAPWKVEGDGGESLRDLLGELRSLMGAARQVAQVGTPAQRQAAQDALSTARKALYKLLAED